MPSNNAPSGTDNLHFRAATLAAWYPPRDGWLDLTSPAAATPRMNRCGSTVSGAGLGVGSVFVGQSVEVVVHVVLERFLDRTDREGGGPQPPAKPEGSGMSDKRAGGG